MKIAIAGLFIVCVGVLVGCTTSSTSEIKTADIAGKTSVAQRAEIHTQRAGEYFKLGRLSIALDAANLAVSVLPSHAPAYNMLALIQMELQENGKAQAAFEQAIKYAPDDSDVLNNYGWFICQRQDAKRSLPYFERAVKNPLYTSPQRAFYNGGICARLAGNLPLAENNFTAALKRDSQFAPALYELAEIAFTQSRVKEADTLLARYNALVRDPDAPVLLLGAKIARAMNDRNAEAGYIAQLRRRFPDSPQAREASAR